MGKIRRGGYLFLWWIGDHPPRHVHVFDAKGKLLGRVTVPGGQPLDSWTPSSKVIRILGQLEKEGRL
jgi:hypothetical protein